jgi:hypothetical protein
MGFKFVCFPGVGDFISAISVGLAGMFFVRLYDYDI